MKAKDIRTKDAAGLAKELTDLQRAHFNLRMQAGTQQLANSSQLGKVRKDIARVKTVMNEVARKAVAK
jgi:large subunit ribosomal protein L29